MYWNCVFAFCDGFFNYPNASAVDQSARILNIDEASYCIAQIGIGGGGTRQKFLPHSGIRESLDDFRYGPNPKNQRLIVVDRSAIKTF